MDRTPDPWNDRLSEYLDGELDAGERDALDHHLRDCETCRQHLEGLRAVVARAATLDDRPPASELWPGVAARIGSATVPLKREARRFAFTLPQLVAAGLALMVLSGGMVWLARLGGPQTDFPAISAETPPVRLANFADGAYEAAVLDLQQTLDAGRSSLDPETIRVLEENLRSIDRAIAQCREALAADPANVYLNTHLAGARTRKLDLLRRAASLVEPKS